MNIKDQLSSLGWSVKAEFLEGNKQRIDDVKRQLLDVSMFLILNLSFLLIYRVIYDNLEKNLYRK
jgi:hypothetical protein